MTSAEFKKNIYKTGNVLKRKSNIFDCTNQKKSIHGKKLLFIAFVFHINFKMFEFEYFTCLPKIVIFKIILTIIIELNFAYNW